MECLGCMLANKQLSVHVIYEDEYVSCILDHDPFNEGHALILPKSHMEDIDDLDIDTSTAVIRASSTIAKVIKKLYHPDGITICQNGGIFSELSHFHLHVIPRYKNQSLEVFYSDQPLQNQHVKDKLLETCNNMKELIKIMRY